MAKKKKAAKKVAKKKVAKKKKVVKREGPRQSMKRQFDHPNEVNVEVPRDRRPPDGKESDLYVNRAIDDGEYFYEEGDFYLGKSEKVRDELLKSGAISWVGDEGSYGDDLEDLSREEILARLINDHGYFEKDIQDKPDDELYSMLEQALEEAA